MNIKSIKIILIEISIVLIAVVLINIINIDDIIPNCLFFEATGLQCPSCGGTRCFLNLLHGNFKAAFLFHPIFFIALTYLLIVNIIYLINLNRKKDFATWIYPKPYYAIIFAVILVVYGFLRNIF